MAVKTEAPAVATEIRPFKIEIPEADLKALRARIAATRWPEKETVDDQSQGVPLETSQALARYWEKEYDWRKVEARLNALPNFITEIDGLDIHFIHVRSKHEDALPLIVTHGWPGSIIEQLKIVGPLTDPTAHGADRVGRLPSGDPVDARLRLLGQAERARLGPRAHRTRLDRADEASRLHAIRRAGRRLGRTHHRRHGSAGAPGTARHPHQHAWRGSARHRYAAPVRHHRSEQRAGLAAGRPLRRGKAGVRAAATSSGSIPPTRS